MSTVFDFKFRYAEATPGHYDSEGNYVEGAVSSREVQGSLQSMTSKQVLAYTNGARTTGSIEIYSSERLNGRNRGGSDGGFVMFEDEIYRIENEQSYRHIDGIEHYRYTASIAADGDVSNAIREELEAA